MTSLPTNAEPGACRRGRVTMRCWLVSELSTGRDQHHVAHFGERWSGAAGCERTVTDEQNLMQSYGSRHPVPLPEVAHTVLAAIVHSHVQSPHNACSAEHHFDVGLAS